jgi:hypothetical protein
MRPFGHTQAREERGVSDFSVDDRLQEAWDAYSRFMRGGAMFMSPHNYAKLLLAFRPSVAALHHLVLKTAQSSLDGPHMGLFLSAGYALLPQRRIVYDLDTPYLESLGCRLAGKRLVIDGRVGPYCGSGMIGSLTINGAAGPFAGVNMIGVMADNTSMTGSESNGLLGCFDGEWNIAEDDRRSFLRAIMNPRHLPYETLERQLVERYTQVQR